MCFDAKGGVGQRAVSDKGWCKAKMEWGREWCGGKDCCGVKDSASHGVMSAQRWCGDKGCLETKGGVGPKSGVGAEWPSSFQVSPS